MSIPGTWQQLRHARTGEKNKPLRDYAPIFAALGDEMRLRLIAALCIGGAMSIAQLTAGTDITRQAITKHLGVLGAGAQALIRPFKYRKTPI